MKIIITLIPHKRLNSFDDNISIGDYKIDVFQDGKFLHTGGIKR